MAPPGEVTCRRTASVSKSRRRRSSAVPASVWTTSSAAPSAGRPPPHAGVDLGLGDERDVGGRAAHERHRRVDERVVEDDERPELGEEVADGAVDAGVLLVVAGQHDRALAHLDGRAGQHAVGRAAGVGRLDGRQRRGRQDRDDRAGAGARPRRPPPRAGAGLWHRTTRSARSASSAFGGQRLAARLGGQGVGALGQRVGAEDGRPQPARERARHVPGSDEADLHGAGD